jgi:hypothetical protein
MTTDNECIAPNLVLGQSSEQLPENQKDLIDSMRELARSMSFANRTIQQALFNAAIELEQAERANASLRCTARTLLTACQSAFALSDRRRVHRGSDPEAEVVESQLRIALSAARRNVS